MSLANKLPVDLLHHRSSGSCGYPERLQPPMNGYRSFKESGEHRYPVGAYVVDYDNHQVKFHQNRFLAKIGFTFCVTDLERLYCMKGVGKLVVCVTNLQNRM